MLKKGKLLFYSIIGFLSGKREITLYFQTLSLSDSLLAMLYSLGILLRITVAKNGRKRLSDEIQKIFSHRAVFYYGSARSALYALLRSLGEDKNAEVIVTGFTCDVVPNAVIQAGYRPVYADIDAERFCMNPESVRGKITERTRILIIQHTYGIPADLEALMAIAREYGLYVIEDCAVSLGSRYRDNLTGTFGDAAIFSFELSKNITSCRGGMLFINTNKMKGLEKHQKFYTDVPEQKLVYTSNVLFQLGLSGILYRPVIFNLGKYLISFMFKLGVFKQSTPQPELEAKMSWNYMLKLSNQQAMILSRQIKRLKEICEHSRKVSWQYYSVLKDAVQLRPFPVQKDNLLNLIRYPVLAEYRQKLLERLQSNGIELGLWFTAPLSFPSIKHELFGYVHGECPNAEDISNKICNLPVHLRINDRDINKILSLSMTN